MNIPLRENIKKFPLPYIINSIREENTTGILRLTNQNIEKDLFIKGGYIIFAASNRDEERLGDLLLKSGRINKEQYDISVRLLKETGKRQGQIFVEQKIITAKELFLLIRQQIKEIIIDLFSWEKGEYEFILGEFPMDEVITLDISTGNIIIEGIKRINNLTLIRAGLPPVDSIPVLSSNPLNIFQDVKLDIDVEKILSLVNGENRIKDICNISSQPEFDALKNIYLLYSTGFILNKTEGVKTQKEEVIEQEPIITSEESVDAEKIHKAFSLLKEQNNYEILGVKENTTEAEIKKAYFRLAKEYHPDRHLNLKEASSDMKNKLEALFARITEAYNILIDEEKKREYDTSLAARFIKHRVKEESKEENINKAKAQFIIGKKNMDKGNFWGAADAFRWAIRLDPNNAKYFSYFGKALSYVPRRLHEAEENCKNAIKLEPTNTEHYINLAIVYKKAGLEAKAKAILEEALKWDPQNETILSELGIKRSSFFKNLFSKK